MNLHQLFKDFADEIRERQRILTEDGIRYIFFACMLRQDPALNNYILELPYELLMMSANNHYSISIASEHNMRPARNGKLGNELDLYYEDFPTSDALCVEFKFHRAGMRNSTLNYTASAGTIINDIKRLQLIQSSAKTVRRLLVYVTDDKMHDYLSGDLSDDLSASKKNDYRNTLSAFYKLSQGNRGTFSFNHSSVPEVFIDAASHSFLSATPPVINVKKLFEDHDFSTPCFSFADGRAHIVIYEV